MAMVRTGKRVAKAQTKTRNALKSGGNLPTLVALLCSDAAIRDPGAKKFSLFGIFDRIIPEKLPVAVNLAIYVNVKGGRGNHRVSLEILDPDGENLLSDSPPVEITCEPDTTKEILLTAVGMNFHKSGEHQLQLKSGGVRIGTPSTLNVVAPSKSVGRKKGA